MKKIFGCLVFTFSMLTLSGQQLYLETGKLISIFDYKNSEGNSLSELKGSSQNSLEMGYRISVPRSLWHFSFVLAHAKYGATSSDLELGNYSEWDAAFMEAGC